MATRRDRWSITRLQRHRTKRKGGLESPTSRQLQLEPLEDRRLLAIGSPQLAGIRVEGGQPLELDGVTRFDTSPQSISLRFDGSQQFSSSPDYLNQAIRITRAGDDGLFGTDDDQRVIPGYIAPGAAPHQNEILIRFAETLPNDLYRVELFTHDDVSSGIQALRNTDGEVLEPRHPDQGRETIVFDLDLGAQIVAVVPQPIHRDPLTGSLHQAEDRIDVYFNRDPLDPSSAETPSLYRVIDTTNESISFPQSVTYDPASFRATLYFADAFPQGTFELQVGVSEESNETTGTATNLGTIWRHASPSGALPQPMPNDEADVSFVAFVGDNLSGAPENDVDLYQFSVQAGGTITADVIPHGDLNVAVRLFDENGVQLDSANVAGSGGVERIEFSAGGAGIYFIGVSSSGNTSYSATSGANATGGTSTGSYRLNMAFSTELTIDNANTSFDTATVVGGLGLGGQVIRSEIRTSAYPIPLPGGFTSLEPGHRDVPVEEHINGSPNTSGSNSVVTAYYNFNDLYGTLPSGSTPINAITEAQKQRAREVFQIYGYYLGIEFIETQTTQGITVVTGDMRAMDPNIEVGPGGVAGISDGSLNGRVIMDAAENWGDSEYGGRWFEVAMHEIGHSIGLGHTYDLQNLTVMGGFGAGEPVFPGDYDLIHARFLYPNASRDIDAYRFDLDEAGWLTAETVAERLPNSSLLNSQLMLYREVPGPNGPVRELLARNDDYFGNDSQIHVYLEPGTYYVAVMSTKQEDVNLEIENSGFGGTTEGDYELHLNFLPVPASSLVDTTGTALDGNFDGNPGGKFQFWFQSGPTIFVDKANDRTPGIDGDGSLADPLDNIASALQLARSTLVMPRHGGDAISDGESFLLIDGISQQARFEFTTSGVASGANIPVTFSLGDSPQDLAQAVADAINGAALPLNVTALVVDGMVRLQGASLIDASASPTLLRSSNIVRIVGNGGPDGDITTITDNRPYLIGFDNQENPLRDGTSLEVPQGVTVMIDAGALIKLRQANLDVGTSAQGLNRQAGALQVLGTPELNVVFASLRNDALGGDSDGPSIGPRPGDWGGIVFRADSDREDEGIFLNWVNQSQIRSAGGLLSVGSVDERFSSIHLVDARPTILFNSIVNSADAAVSADPRSFRDEDGRLGPMVRGNQILENSINGLFVRIQTELGSVVDRIDLPTRWANTDIVHVVTENVLIASQPGGPLLNAQTGNRDARIDGRLRVDPGVVVKIEGSRFEGLIGSQLIAEGTPQKPIIFTSLSDASYGAGGTFQTKRDDQGTPPAPGDWGGMIFNATSQASLDHVVLAFAGGLVPIEGGFARFNALEAHQADFRLTNSTVRNNASGQHTGVNPTRNGRGTNAAATLFVRGAQPIVVNNVFRDNLGSVIHINANSMQEATKADHGRTTGWVGAFEEFADNHGPLVRLNRLDNNSINGMEIRGGVLTTESVWDDTDIAHVLRAEIGILNHHTFSGLRLQSSVDASLVVKLSGASAGFTANGIPLDIDDRIGGTLHVVGMPGRPVILTSLADDTVTAGFNLQGQPQGDTNNNGPSVGSPGQWRSIRLDQYSNDRNVAVVIEKEPAYTGTTDPNGTTGGAQFLGVLAPNEKSGDVNRRLGFEVHGHISYDRPSDVDVYSFTATPGTEVWFDIDRTNPSLDTVLELLDSNGNVVARSTSNSQLSGLALPLIKDAWRGTDFFTVNSRDAGMRVILPGNPSASPSPTYYVRVRSMPDSGDVNDPLGGATSGQYLLQVRLRQVDEKPGSTIRNADIRYATNGIEVIGLPKHSPLSGESYETSGANDTFATAQALGNLLASDRNTISVGGSLTSANDVDWYSFTLDYDLIQAIGGRSDGARTFATIFDIDYADGLARPDTVLSVFDAQGNLILISRDSNVQDDQAGAAGLSDLSRGSAGALDPFIGSVQLPAGVVPVNVTRQYYVAISSNAQLPQALNATFTAAPANPLIRLEPINSVRRIAEDHIGFQGHTTGTSTSSVNVTPVTQLFSINNAVNLSTHVVPFTLNEVVLYVAQGNRLWTANAFSGGLVTDVGQLSAPGANTMRDITIRSDGQMFGVETIAGAANTAGRLVQIDPGNAAEVVIGNDSIPDFDPATDPPNPNQLTSDVVEALAYQRTGVATYDLYYAVVGPGGNTTTLFRANPATGSAAVVADQPWGVRGQIFADTPGDLGRTTGMAFIGGTLYGVSSGGHFFTINLATGRANVIANLGVNFSGLTLGPQNLQGGAFANFLFAVTSTGNLMALNTSGVQQPIFANGATTIQTVGGATGLAFSPLDFNLWHPTMRRGTDPGHGINPSFDASRTADFTLSINGRQSSQQSGGASFYFGLEQWVEDPVNAYFTYGPNAQYGIGAQARHQDLTSTAEIGNNYNLPGGALGSLQTNSFSLAGYAAADKPTLYFNYFLETQNANAVTNSAMRDSARVFVSPNGGITWVLVATNNSILSTPGQGAELPQFISTSVTASNHARQGVQELFDNTGGWRQARVDLSDFAGASDLLLRFDFSTAGSMGQGIFGDQFGNFNNAERGQNNQFEGFYIDDIIVGFSERGEMVTGSTENTAFAPVPPPVNAPSQVLSGSYQLEIRRGTEYGANVNQTGAEILVYQQFDTNTRLIRELGRLGDSNLHRDQGQVLIESNTISYVSQYGVRIDAAARGAGGNLTSPGSPINGPTLNTQRLVPGVHVENNVLANFGQGGVLFSGDAVGGTAPVATVPFGRIVNNTIYGGATATGVGIQVTENASPTILNNILANSAVGIQIDGTSGSTVVGANLFRGNTANGTLGENAIQVPVSEALFVNAAVGNFYLAQGARAIDSSLNSLADRASFVNVKSPLGIPPTPIFAPDRDRYGQFRVDDPGQAPPPGLGSNIFKDRGAVERADDTGPTASMHTPQNNDAAGLDLDPSNTVVYRTDGMFEWFEIRLQDVGVGVDATTVVADAITVTQDGRLLQSGADYTVSYSETSGLIRIIPLNGIGQTSSVYVITLNNRDRSVLTAPSGDQVDDSDRFELTDANGVKVVFEYDSGYTLQVPRTLTLQVPAQGGASGGITDGSTFRITHQGTTVTFEFDNNQALVNANHVRVTFATTDSSDAIAHAIADALRNAGLGLSPKVLPGGQVHVGGTQTTAVEPLTSQLTVSGNANAVVDGQTFTIDHPDFGLQTFEFDLQLSDPVAAGNIAVPYRLSDTQDDLARILGDVIRAAGIDLTPLVVGSGLLHVGGVQHVLSTGDTNLVVSGEPGVTSNLRLRVPTQGGAAGGVSDGQTFTITDGSVTRVFEFDDDGETTSGNIIISMNPGITISSQDQLSNLIVQALLGSGLNLVPEYLGEGIISVGGEAKHLVNVSGSSLGLTGIPGGAVPIRFIPHSSFSGREMGVAISGGINTSTLGGVHAVMRAGNTLFVEGLLEGAANIDNIAQFTVGAIKDLAGNNLQPNLNSGETRFHVLIGETNFDFGDAPDGTIPPLGQFGYPTVFANNGARHVLYANHGLYLGQRVDADPNGRPSIAADGDDLAGDGLIIDISQSPALSVSGNLTPAEIFVPETLFLQVTEFGSFELNDGETFSISDGMQTVVFELDSNNVLTDGLHVRIPFSPGSTSEQVAAAIVTAIQGTTLGLSPVDLGFGRVHLGSRSNHSVDTSAVPGISSGGVAATVTDGDTFSITRNGDTFTFEFDENFSTTNGNTAIFIDPSLTYEQIADRIATAIVGTNLGITPLHAGGGVVNLDGNDEDGATFTDLFNPFIDTPITIYASTAGLLDAWIDANQDGDFLDPGEKVLNSVALAAGKNIVIVRAPVGSAIGETYMRFRFSELGGLDPHGLAASGEVEDYVIEIVDGLPPVAVDDPAIVGQIATDEDTPIFMTTSILANDFDPDPGDVLTVLNPGTFLTQRGAEVVLDADGTFSYDPTVSEELQRLPVGVVVNDTFTYQAFDGFLTSNEATVTIRVTGMNDTPIVVPLQLAAVEDGPAIGGTFIGDDTDDDDNTNTLIYTVVATPSEGLVTNLNNGTFTFDPLPDEDFQDLALGETRDVFFSYTATDRHGAVSDPAIVTITVTGVNDIPTADNMFVSVTEDDSATTWTIAADDIDSDDDTATLTYSFTDIPTLGTFTYNGDGTFTFDPGDDFQDLAVGDMPELLVRYTATDRHGATSPEATITIQVVGLNDTPVVQPLELDAVEDGPALVQIFPGSDIDNDDNQASLLYTILDFPAEGLLTNNDDGTFTFDVQPGVAFQDLALGETRVVFFVYNATDQHGAVSDSATVTITVTGVNDTPTVEDMLVTVIEDGVAVSDTFAADDIDSDDDTTTLTYVFGSMPPGGTLTNNGDGTFTFDPGADFQELAQDEVLDIPLTYRAVDRHGATSPEATITIRVTGVNDMPVIQPLELAAVEDGPSLTLQFPGSDIDSDDNQASLLYTILDFPAEGLLTNNDDGTFTFDVLPGVAFQDLAVGETRDVFFVYTATDRHGATTDPATVTITVTGVNDTPTIEDMLITVVEDGPAVTATLAANDIDSDDDTSTLTYLFDNIPTLGTAAYNGDGTVTFDPGTDFQELAQDEELDLLVTYQAMDRHGATSPVATITIRVIGVNDTPVVQPLELAAVEDGPTLTGLFPGDDIDSDDDQSTLVYSILEFPAEGLLTNNDDTSFTFDVVPGVDFQDLAVGETRDVFFVYTATDRHGAVSDPATVTITVTGVNDTPTAEDMFVGAVEDGPAVTFGYLADDVDSDDDVTTLVYTFLNIPAEGTIRDNGDGTFTFDPGPEFQDLGVGEFRDVFVAYTATDRHGATSVAATITVRVDGVNDPPIAVDDATLQSGYSTARGQVLTISSPDNGLLMNDFDPDTNDIIVVKDAPATVLSAAGATIVIFADGTFTYDPRTSASLQQLPLGSSTFDTFVYTITDNNGGEDSATVSIFVTGQNSPPIANPILVFAVEDGPSVTQPFLGDDGDGDDDQSTLTYQIIAGTGPTEGAIFNNFNGTFTFSPRDDFQDLRPGETRDVFAQYRAVDRHGAISNVGTITIRVEGVNDAPVAVDDLGILNERNTSIVINVLANDFDFDGSPFDLSSVEVVQQPGNGTATPNPDGTITYTPNTNFSGQDIFTYRFRDDEGPDSLWSNIATVGVTTTAFPVAGSTSVQTLQNTSIDINIMSLASDADGTVNPASITVVSGPSNGTYSIDPVTGILTYTPNAGYLGPDSLQYTVRDNVGATSAPGTISISVLSNLTPYRNPRNPLDVNDDGRVNAFDVLLIVAFLQTNGSGVPTGPVPPYLDVAAPDNFVSPFDALVIVSYLNDLMGMGEGDGPGEGEGEGESFFAAALASPTQFAGTVLPEATSPRSLMFEETPRFAGVRLSPEEPMTLQRRSAENVELLAPAVSDETISPWERREGVGAVAERPSALDDALVEEIARSVKTAREGDLADRALMALLYESDYAVKRHRQ